MFARVIDSTTEMARAHDGAEQLRRHWAPTGSVRAAMLIVHGIGEHSGRYEHVGAAFADAGVDVLAYDQRGFGRSGGIRAHVDDFDEYLDDVEVLLAARRELGVPVILLGHSLGGLVATAYLVSGRPQPDLAVLSAPALGAQLPGWQRTLAPVVGKVVPRLKIPADFDGALLSRDEAVQVAYENDPLRVPFSTASLGREILATMKTTRATLDRLRVPTYVFHGGDDELVPTSASEILEVLPNVTRRVWPNLRHESMNEPERADVIAEVLGWIEDQL